MEDRSDPSVTVSLSGVRLNALSTDFSSVDRVAEFEIKCIWQPEDCVVLAMETLIVFDFDWSLIDCNSDTWVVEKLGAMERMKSLTSTLPWTQLMVTNRIISIRLPQSSSFCCNLKSPKFQGCGVKNWRTPICGMVVRFQFRVANPEP